jgi:hypothetical protein
VVRTKCRKSETTLSLSSLTNKVTEQQGGAGSEFVANVSDGFSSDVTIPAATVIPGGGFTPPTTIPGSKSLTATCASGVVFGASCESQELTSLTVTIGITGAGKSVQCS